MGQHMSCCVEEDGAKTGRISQRKKPLGIENIEDVVVLAGKFKASSPPQDSAEKNGPKKLACQPSPLGLDGDVFNRLQQTTSEQHAQADATKNVSMSPRSEITATIGSLDDSNARRVTNETEIKTDEAAVIGDKLEKNNSYRENVIEALPQCTGLRRETSDEHVHLIEAVKDVDIAMHEGLDDSTINQQKQMENNAASEEVVKIPTQSVKQEDIVSIKIGEQARLVEELKEGEKIRGAILLGNIDYLKFIVERDQPDLTAPIIGYLTPFTLAAMLGKVGVMKYLLTQDDRQLFYATSAGETVLSIACMLDQLDTVKFLMLQCDWHLCTGDHFGRTPFFRAISSDSIATANYLLPFDSNQLYIANVFGEYPLTMAVKRKNICMLTFLIDQHKKDSNRCIEIFRTVLLDIEDDASEAVTLMLKEALEASLKIAETQSLAKPAQNELTTVQEIKEPPLRPDRFRLTVSQLTEYSSVFRSPSKDSLNQAVMRLNQNQIKRMPDKLKNKIRSEIEPEEALIFLNTSMKHNNQEIFKNDYICG